jgi:hypothetical protein
LAAARRGLLGSSGRYRLLDRPTLTLDDGFPSVGLSDEPLIDGRVGFKLNIDAAAFGERDGIEHVHRRRSTCGART